MPFSKIKNLGFLVIVLLFYILIFVFYLSHHQWNLTSFFVFGEENKITQLFINDNIFVNDDSRGYDGQTFYLIAKNPFDFKTINDAIDSSIWRYQRIFYPLLLYFLSFGQPKLLIFLFPLVNLLAILGGVYFLSKILEIYRVNKWFSLFYGLYPGFIFTFLYNLAEPLAYFLVILSIYCFLRNKLVKSVVFLILAIFTKETCLFIAVGIILFLLITKEDKYRPKIAWYLLPITVFIIWYVALFFIFTDNNAMVSSVYFNLGLPFIGLIKKMLVLVTFSPFEITTDFFFFLFFFASAIYIIIDLFKRINLFNLTAVLFLSFILLFAPPLLYFPKEYTRHFLGFFLFFLLSYLPTKNKAIPILLTGFLLSDIFYLIDIFILLNFFR